MHKTYEYTSIFAPLISDYISTRRKSGFEFDNQSYWLYKFDQYCAENGIDEAILTKSTYDGWSHKSNTETKTTQSNRLQAIRGFCVYLNSLGINSYIPHNLPKPEKNVPYLMTDIDIREFFEQVDLYRTSSALGAFNRMSYEYIVLFRLIYCCGLRINEACTLKIHHVDLDRGAILLHHTKGNKERLVYMPEDLRILFIDYLAWLNNELSNAGCEWVFPGKNPGEHIRKTSIDKKFNELWNRTSASRYADKKPTVHCLRHAFVIKRVNLWMEEKISLQVMMPYLSAYLGHKSPLETYYYYHQVEDVFKTIRAKDEISALVIPEVQYEE